jgi:hypothetical protein
MTAEMTLAEIQRDGLARVVESLVTRGDVSLLSPIDRARHYVQMCENLGLNPHTQPFAFLRLNGKEVMYATRGATDQLAATHRLNREIIDGPKIIDVLGTKIGYCACKATHPNGRTETATATLPAVDPVNLFMKLETKAKRRATLSILGLGMLDESEVADIPASAKEALHQIDAKDLDKPEGSRAFAAFVLRVTSLPSVTALLTAYHTLIADLREEGHDPAEYLADGADDPAALGAASLVGQRVWSLGHRLAKVDLTALLTDGGEKIAAGLDSQAEALAGKAGMDAHVAIVEWWRSHRGELASDKPTAKVLYGALVRRWDGSDEPPDGPRTKKARSEMERALEIASKDAGRTSPESSQPQARRVREVLPGTDAEIRAHVGGYGHPRAIENAAKKYAPMPALHRALADRLLALVPADADGTRLTERGALLQVEAWGRQEPTTAARKAVGR